MEEEEGGEGGSGGVRDPPLPPPYGFQIHAQPWGGRLYWEGAVEGGLDCCNIELVLYGSNEFRLSLYFLNAKSRT